MNAKTKQFFGLGALAILVAGALGAFSAPQSNASSEPQANYAAAPVKAVPAADAIYYTTQFKANEVAAKMQYGNDPVIVRGIIKEIRLDAWGNAIVALDDDTFGGFRVRFNDDEKPRVAQLKVGDRMEARGDDLKLFGGAMFLHNATILN